MSEYRTIQGDTWEGIAFRLWGAEHMAPYLLAANPAHLDVLSFPAGIVLTVPSVTVRKKSAGSLPPWVEVSA